MISEKITEVKEILDMLYENYHDCENNKKDAGIGEFDLIRAIGGGSINENAHTRILAALLEIRPVRKLFWSVLIRKYPQRGLEELMSLETKEVKVNVRCFENYLDACITLGECKVIIENKVKGACDQPGQIDRYVDMVVNQGIEAKKIFVLYITQSGGSPSEESFKEAKKVLGVTDDSSGRFFELDYLHDILPFLYELLGRRTEQCIAENARESFRGGVIQYVNYIEGSCLLGLREQDDGFEAFRKKVRENLSNASSLMSFFTCAEWLLLKQRRVLEMTSEWKGIQSIEVKRNILKYRFYREFNVAVPDDEFYVPIYLDNDAVVSMGMWEDLAESLVQVDFWSDAPNDKYRKMVEEMVANLEKNAKENAEGTIKQYRVMQYNNCDMVRFRIATLDDLSNVIGLFKRLEICKDKRENSEAGTPVEDEMHVTSGLDCNNVDIEKVYSEEMIRQMKVTARISRSERHKPFDSLWNKIEVEDKNLKIDHGYSYYKGWAIQLNENLDEYMRVVDVFPKRGIPAGETLKLQQAFKAYPCRILRWDGRVFCRFPVPTEEYAKKLLIELSEWRKELKKCS